LKAKLSETLNSTSFTAKLYHATLSMQLQIQNQLLMHRLFESEVVGDIIFINFCCNTIDSNITNPVADTQSPSNAQIA